MLKRLRGLNINKEIAVGVFSKILKGQFFENSFTVKVVKVTKSKDTGKLNLYLSDTITETRCFLSRTIECLVGSYLFSGRVITITGFSISEEQKAENTYIKKVCIFSIDNIENKFAFGLKKNLTKTVYPIIEIQYTQPVPDSYKFPVRTGENKVIIYSDCPI